MNNHVKRMMFNLVLLSGALLFSLTTFLLLSGCELGGRPIIENQRDQGVRIYVILLRTDSVLKEPDKPTD